MGTQPGQRRVLIVGAGDAGTHLVREMQSNPDFRMAPVGFIDDDRSKHGTVIYGVPVLGDRTLIPTAVKAHQAHEVIIAMPAAPGEEIQEIKRICDEDRIPVRIIPGTQAILTGQVSVRQAREIQIEDLLRREPIHTDLNQVRRLLHGRRVLVTGAGGSIGSELCRQIAWCDPSSIVLLGHGENSLFRINRELREQYPDLSQRVFVGDIRDRARLEPLFREFQPEVVFHAAAHKHVTLMEDNPEEAVTNNVLGTRVLVELSEAHNVERFVLISTDKAVNPTSVMGATKRVAELLVKEAALRTGRCFVSVRFGNVLGSRGSVVLIFQEQIRRGGPVTVTHPEARRYFLTIPEAVQLVLQAVTLGQGGEVFILNMGKPVSILELARHMIELSGLRPDEDVPIAFTGLHPGEKISEELFLAGEDYQGTAHEKVFVVNSNDVSDHDLTGRLGKYLDALIASAAAGDALSVRALLRSLVPEYHPPDVDLVDRATSSALSRVDG